MILKEKTNLRMREFSYASFVPRFRLDLVHSFNSKLVLFQVILLKPNTQTLSLDTLVVTVGKENLHTTQIYNVIRFQNRAWL